MKMNYQSFKNNDFCQVIRNILYMDEEKKTNYLFQPFITPHNRNY